MIASPAHIATQVQSGRNPKRALAARKSEKKRTSGSPSRAAGLPGTTNAIESFVKTAGWWSVIDLVGPRQTESASMKGITSATATTR